MNRLGRSESSHVEAWDYLRNDLKADLALVQEASPTEDLGARVYRPIGEKPYNWGSAVVALRPGLTLRPRRRVPLADSLFVAVALDELPDSHPGASAVADVLLDGRQLFTAVSLYAQWEMMPGSKTMMYAGPRLHRMLSDLTGVLASSHRNPVVLAGDFNVTSQGARSSDNEAAAVFARLRAWRMADCIARMGRDQAGAADCKCPDGAACSHVRTFRTGTQLDYAFVSDSIVPALLDCGTEATAEAWRRSDHCPIVIDLDERAIWQTQQTA